ncbi:MAG: histidinol dehydrogenase [Deltaproteobacteria bacterium]|nr:histidinol dehydrogenase [Deltaproteobacteria bacterium]
MIKIYQWKSTSEEDKRRILQRAALNIEEVKAEVQPWIDAVKEKGDEAVLAYIRKFDSPQFDASRLRVTEDDVNRAYRETDPLVVRAIQQQVELSRRHHQRHLQDGATFGESVEGVLVGRRFNPVESAGLYVPAGKAPLPTVMQILGVAAKVAKVSRVAACFPPTGNHHEIIIAADQAGVDEVYRVGGVAAIAAMAYGTATIRPVAKIAGPGNIYVQAAKILVFGQVSIDMPAGPSEAVILADGRANPTFIASDILARAEHDENAAGVLITWDPMIARETKRQVESQIVGLRRQDIIRASLKRYSAIILVDSLEEAIDLTNEYAPEHLEIMTEYPWAVLERIKHAGSIFLGEFAPVAVGDYASGTNHVLPTGGWARMFSAVGVDTFLKASEFQYLSRRGLQNLQEIVEAISAVEGLDAHGRSVTIRLENDR